ncbi:MAG: phage holin family protein [Bdellovibrionota bacterium]
MRIALLHWIVSGLAFLATAYFVPGFKVNGFFAALIAAVVVGIGNALLWPVLAFLTLPITLVTLGLFLFVVNGIVIKICAAFVPGFEVTSWTAAILGSIVLTVFGTLFKWFVGLG